MNWFDIYSIYSYEVILFGLIRLTSTSGVLTLIWRDLKQKLKRNRLLQHSQQKRILHLQSKVNQ
jgi:hypothetical protein